MGWKGDWVISVAGNAGKENYKIRFVAYFDDGRIAESSMRDEHKNILRNTYFSKIPRTFLFVFALNLLFLYFAFFALFFSSHPLALMPLIYWMSWAEWVTRKEVNLFQLMCIFIFIFILFFFLSFLQNFHADFTMLTYWLTY